MHALNDLFPRSLLVASMALSLGLLACGGAVEPDPAAAGSSGASGSGDSGKGGTGGSSASGTGGTSTTGGSSGTKDDGTSGSGTGGNATQGGGGNENTGGTISVTGGTAGTGTAGTGTAGTTGGTSSGGNNAGGSEGGSPGTGGAVVGGSGGTGTAGTGTAGVAGTSTAGTGSGGTGTAGTGTAGTGTAGSTGDPFCAQDQPCDLNSACGTASDENGCSTACSCGKDGLFDCTTSCDPGGPMGPCEQHGSACSTEGSGCGGGDDKCYSSCSCKSGAWECNYTCGGGSVCPDVSPVPGQLCSDYALDKSCNYPPLTTCSCQPDNNGDQRWQCAF